MRTPPACDRLYDLKVKGGGEWRGMNLVKKTPVRFHWRLSTSLSYRGGEPEGEIREVEEEEEEEMEEEMERGLTLEGEKCFPATSFFCSSPPLDGVFCQSLKVVQIQGTHAHTCACTHTHTHTHTHTTGLYFCVKQDSA